MKSKFMKQWGSKLQEGSEVILEGNDITVVQEEGKAFFEFKDGEWQFVTFKEW